MKVILLKDVAKIGRRFEVADVPAGYAQNQLIPKGMAEPASPANLKKIQKLNVDSAAASAEAAEAFAAAMKVLKETVVKVPADLNEKNHTFKAVSEAEIAEAAKANGVNIDAAMIKISSPIKEAGEHQVVLRSGENQAEFTVEVIKK